MVVSVTASIRVAVEISSNLFSCMFCGGISSFYSGNGCSDICWVVILLVVMVGYWWSNYGGGDDDSCCNGNSSCD